MLREIIAVYLENAKKENDEHSLCKVKVGIVNVE